MIFRRRHGHVWPLLFFGLIGAVLLLVGLGHGWRQKQILAWPQVAATVTSSRVTLKTPTTYGAEITFRYHAAGQERSAIVSPGYETSIRQEMQAKVQDFAPGSRHLIRVDPANPGNVIFDAAPTLEFFMVPLVLSLMGAVFLAIALGGAWLERSLGQPKIAPTTDRVPQMVGGTFAIIGVLLLLVAGAMGLIVRSRGAWPQTQATVARSRVVNYFSGGNNGQPVVTYYAVEIEFRYRVGKREFVAPLTVANNNKSRPRAEALLTPFAPGTKHLIHYDPTDPHAIQFENEGLSWVWIIGALGAGFCAIGLLCVVAFRADKLAPQHRQSAAL